MRRAKEVVAEHESRHPHAGGRVREAVGRLLVTDTYVGVHDPTTRTKVGSGLWGHVGTLLFGMVFIGFSIPFVVVFTPDGDASTTGVVTGVQRTVGEDGDTCSLATEYVVDGRTHQGSSGISSSSFCSTQVGDPVEVLYDSTDPADSEVHGGWGVWIVWLFPLAGALIFLPSLVGVVLALAVAATGRRMVREGRRSSAMQPAASSDQHLVDEATREVTAAIVALRATKEPVVEDELDAAPVPYYADAPALASDEVAPGWYRTVDGTSERWHNGVEWTPHVRPAPPL